MVKEPHETKRILGHYGRGSCSSPGVFHSRRNLYLTQEIFGPAGKLVRTGTTSVAVSAHASRDLTQEIAPLDHPQVWSPDNPLLYRIRTSLDDEVVGKDGTVVPSPCHTIAFNSYGPGELLPQTWAGHATGLKWEAVAGMTRIALRPTSRVGRARISAYCPGLVLGRVEVQVVAKGKRDEMEYSRNAAVYR